MAKPDHVKCETCVFWHPEPNCSEADPYGFCCKNADARTRAGVIRAVWCGDWRKDWAGEEDLEWTAAAIDFCRGVNGHILKSGSIGTFARAFLEARKRTFLPETDAAIRQLGG